MDLNIIWTLSKEGVFEQQWIYELFELFTINEIVDTDLNTVLDNSLIIVQDINNSHWIEYLKKYDSSGYNFRILHISDEALVHDVSYYDQYKDKIIRMIYSEEYTNKWGMMTIPVGFKPGLKKMDVDKKYLVNFIGQIKSDRNHMIRVYKDIEPKFFSFTNQWNDPNGIDTNSYSRILSESHFTLCPSGWVSVDSFRINEAMECGSIPVSIMYGGKNYFEMLYGPNPFVIGKDWEETTELIKNINIEEKKKEVEDWWKDYKRNLKLKLKDFIETN